MAALDADLVSLRNFLEKNHTALLDYMKKMGYPSNGPGFTTEGQIDTAIERINEFLENPFSKKAIFGIYLLNESLTTMHSMLTQMNQIVHPSGEH